MSAPLAGLRVIDLSRVLAGPWCTQLLADLGADVIKVERPGRGDDTRQWGPHWLANADGSEGSESSYYLAANRNKRSVTIDLAQSDGRDLVIELVRDADVFVENFKVGSLDGKGLGFETLHELNPRLIYASITGFGQDGPRSADPGYDYLAQALSGFMSITGDPDGPPVRAGVAISDLSTGMYATVAILAAVIRRSVSGEGQFIDVALLDSQTAMLANQAMSFLVSGETPHRSGPWHPSLAPYQLFDAADGEFVIACGNDGQFRTLCNVIGRPELAADPRFVDNPGRVRNREALVAELNDAIRRQPRAHWLDALPSAGVPAGSVNTIADAFDEPQLVHRGIRVELPHATAGTVPGVANPIKFGESPVEYRSGPPLLGQHTVEVLGDVLGLDTEHIEDLRVRGVV